MFLVVASLLRVFRLWLVLVVTFCPALLAQEAVEKSPGPGEKGTNPIDGQAYVWVPPGTFQMGCVPGDQSCDPDESPRHSVTLSRGFWMGATEVPVAAFERYAAANGMEMPEAPDVNPNWQHKNHPVVRMDWSVAKSYCAWSGGRLPTEAEFEFAARAGHEGLPYPWGLKITHLDANYRGTGDRDVWKATAPVGSFLPNSFGLHDVSGNVWEWIADWYDPKYYESSPPVDPPGPDAGVERVLRGGSWFTVERVLRTSDRFKYVDVARDSSVGFRCVLEELPAAQ
jgi:formylglycine-generating enzyme required for sulfatase activity